MKLSNFLLVCFCFAFVGGCSEPELEKTEKLRPVKTIFAKQPSDAGERIFNGNTRTSQETNISFKVSGNIQTLNVKVGESIKKGAVLARLETDTYEARFAQAKADLAKSFAIQQSAIVEFDRLKGLIERNLVSQSQFEKAKAEADSSIASYQAAQQAQSIAALDLEYTSLTINDDCVIAELFVRENENVTAGQSIAKASCGNIWEVVINVPENLIASFKLDSPASINLPSKPNQTFGGRVTEIGIGTNETSSYPVTVQIETPPENLRVNNAAEVSILLPLPEDIRGNVFVPLQAVSSDQDGRFVYLVTATDSTGVAVLNRQTVSVGNITPFGLAITQGLQAGDEILFAGHVNARDGMRVKHSSSAALVQE